MLGLLKRLLKEEEGQAMSEYGLVLGIIAVGVIVALTALRDQLKTLFDTIKTNLTTH